MRRIQAARPTLPIILLGVGLCWAAGCSCEPAGASDLTRFNHMEQVDLTVNDHVFRAWVAKTDKDRESGFMYVEPELLATLDDGAEPGMIFAFGVERPAHYGFWMKNVPVNLDIAFIDGAGTIVSVKTMAAYDWNTTASDGPYQFALEVRGGLMSQLGITSGDTMDIPDAVLNNIE